MKEFNLKISLSQEEIDFLTKYTSDLFIGINDYENILSQEECNILYKLEGKSILFIREWNDDMDSSDSEAWLTNFGHQLLNQLL